jgi:prophage regulatory protein
MAAIANAPNAQCVRLIDLREVERLSGRRRSGIYAGVVAGEFPRPIKDGARSRWVESEVLAWIAARIAERDGCPA